jgi:hypothetical protein
MDGTPLLQSDYAEETNFSVKELIGDKGMEYTPSEILNSHLKYGWLFSCVFCPCIANDQRKAFQDKENLAYRKIREYVNGDIGVFDVESKKLILSVQNIHKIQKIFKDTCPNPDEVFRNDVFYQRTKAAAQFPYTYKFKLSE